MATFAHATFNAVAYASFRPTYPKALFDAVYRFHALAPNAKWDRAVDLGCGTGQATTVLADRFKDVVGVEPSSSMVAKAQDGLDQNLTSRVSFVKSSAEELAFLDDNSVDLITAAQAAHWFDYTRLWPEVARTLRPGGTAAFWCYSEFRFTNFPSLTASINDYASTPGRNLAPYWEQPGRGRLDLHLQGVRFPTNGSWTAQDGKDSLRKRIYFVGERYSTETVTDSSEIKDISNNPIKLLSSDEQAPVIIRKQLTWDLLDKYLRTWSALHTFQEKTPEDAKNPDGDIVQRLVKKLKKEMEESTDSSVDESVDTGSNSFEIEWPLALIMVKKAQ